MTSFVSSLPFTQRLHSRHQYQMLPSKDGDLRVTASPTGTPVEEHRETFEGTHENDRLSWKEQAKVDLKPSAGRDT